MFNFYVHPYISSVVFGLFYVLIGIDIAQKSVEMIYFKEVKFWGFLGYFLFPKQKIADCKNVERYSSYCYWMKMAHPLNPKKFSWYIFTTILFWPVRLAYSVIFLLGYFIWRLWDTFRYALDA